MPIHFERVILRPAVGRVINYVTQTPSADNQLVDNIGVNTTIYGNNGDYLILERVVSGGFNCIRVTAVVSY